MLGPFWGHWPTRVAVSGMLVPMVQDGTKAQGAAPEPTPDVREQRVAWREGIAEERERMVEERERMADERERMADERERVAGEREARASRREQAAIDREVTRAGWPDDRPPR